MKRFDMSVQTPQPILRRLRDDRGAVLLQVIIAALVLIGFVAFVVDQGLLFVARRQLQNVADAGALAGAIGYTFDPLPGQDPRIPAEASARALTDRHRVLEGGAMGVNVSWDCPAWMVDESGCVRVDVYRDGTNGSALLPVFMSQVFGRNAQRGRATATAQAAAANFSECLKPWMIPDGFFNADGQRVLDRGFDPEAGDYYIRPTADSSGTGWSENDIGTQLMLNPPGPQEAIAPSHFYQLTQGNEFDDAILGCTLQQGIGDTIPTFPGGSVGLMRHAVEELLRRNDGEVVVPIGMFDPAYFEEMRRKSGKIETLEIVNMMGFRITGMTGKGMFGTIVETVATFNPANMETQSLIKVIRLVQ
jgi:hypothetical protein